MSSQIRILKHLKEKGIAFELLQSGLDHSGKSELNSIVFKWKKKFIGQKTAPYLDKYLWHIFSFEAVQCLMGESAKKELLRQYAADTFIFNERQQFLIRCIATIPILELDNFNDDIYISVTTT